MKKRIFIAIAATPKLKKAILKFRQQNSEFPVRWMTDNNLHLTIIPPHDLSDNEIVGWIEKLETIEGQFGPIEIEFDKICFGPNPWRPRLIWVKGEENFKLESLKNKITDVLNLRKDGRPYFAHLTIARFKPHDFNRFPVKDLCVGINWLETARSFEAIQSELSEKGAKYTGLAKIKL